MTKLETGGLQILWHHYHDGWTIGWGHFHHGLAAIYRWWIQVGPLEIRRWR